MAVTRRYFDVAPSYHLFGGTPLADRHGGWGKQVEIVEFFHRVEDMVNAVVEAGLQIVRVTETNDGVAPTPGKRLGIEAVPSHFMILARKG